MLSRFPVVALPLLAAGSCCHPEEFDSTDVPDPVAIIIRDRVVDASCGQCQLGLPGEGCDLAVAIDGTAYYVDGSHIDDHGNAHGTNGLCNVIRQAAVSGNVVEGRFLAHRFDLVTDNAP